jgi:outer membrane protein assembly factor BamB
MRKVLITSLTLGLLWTGSVQSQDRVKTGDWPEWRGPQRDGICSETGLLPQWPEGGPRLLWSAREVNKGKNVGTGYASVVIAQGRIFTLGDRDKQGCVICLDEATGKVLWVTPFCRPYGGDGPRSTPTVAGNRLYGLSPHGDLVCVDTEQGSILWQKDLKKDLGGQMMSGWNYSESPLVDGEQLICTPGGQDAALAALNKETGEVLWKCAVPSKLIRDPKRFGAGYASIVVAEVGGIRQYVTFLSQDLGLVGVEAKTGKYLWNYNKVANGTANIPTALVRGDHLFASTAYNTGAALLQLVPDEQGGVRAKEVYFLKPNVLQNHHGGMILLGDYVYGGHGHTNGLPFCLELKSGKLMWGPERGAGERSAAVLYADGHLYFRYENNVMALIEATPKGYHLKSSFQLPKGTSNPGWQHPVIHQGRLYLRANDQLYCYDIKQ